MQRLANISFPGQQINWGSPQAQGLITAWALNDGGGLTVRSCCGRYDGSISGTAPAVVQSPLGKALKFSAASTKVTIPGDIAGSGAFSITFWINVAGAGGGGYGRIFVGDNFKTIVWTDNSQRVRFSSDGSLAASITGAFNTLLHYAFARTASGTCYGYLNAVLTANGIATGTPAANGANTYIGNQSDSTRNLNATLYDVRTYNKVLSAKEVQDIYVNPMGIYLPKKIIIPMSSVVPPTPVTSYRYPIMHRR